MERIATIDYWRQQLGLYPMLTNRKKSGSKFLMLNGGNKDFCIQTGFFAHDRDTFFSDSWSTNTKIFLAFDNDFVHVYNWLQTNSAEKYPLKRVEENIDRFYTYISTRSYKTPDDAIPHIISIFRHLRNFTKEKDPQRALNLLFKLLISLDREVCSSVHYKSGKFVVERGCSWIPKKTIGLDAYYFYLSLFSSDIFDFLLSIFSKQLAGGNWYDLGAKYTKNIPIPNIYLPEVQASDSFTRLVELGKELEVGNPYVKHAIGDALKIFYPKMIDVKRIHFAMNADWQRNGKHVHTMDNEQQIVDWLQGMLAYIRNELMNI